MRQTTLKEVAQEAGVSIKTVSRVVNKDRGVSPTTAARVHQVVMELGYQPNEVARSLRGKRSRTIGLVIADSSNPFYAECGKAVEEISRKHGYMVILCASDESEDIENDYALGEMIADRRLLQIDDSSSLAKVGSPVGLYGNYEAEIMRCCQGISRETHFSETSSEV